MLSRKVLLTIITGGLLLLFAALPRFEESLNLRRPRGTTSDEGSPVSHRIARPHEESARSDVVLANPTSKSEFQNWLLIEAQAFDEQPGAALPPIQEKQRLQKLDQKIQGMQTEEWELVAAVYMNADAPQNQRVVAAYLLRQGGERFPKIRNRVLANPLPSGPFPPGSHEEAALLLQKKLRQIVLQGR